MKYSHTNQITKQEIKNFIEEKVPEGKYLEYKREFNFSTNGQKKELLADICSFANSGGGTIIYGIEEEKDESNKNTGLPKEIIGLTINIDETIRSVEESVRKSIEPVLIGGIKIKEIKFDEKSLLILFIPKSSNSPHRVKFQGVNRFYKRANASRYEIPIEELKKDFLSGIEIFQRISEFRSERITKILSNDTPLLNEGPKLVLHIMPVHYFDKIQAFENLDFDRDGRLIRLMDHYSTPEKRLNFHGYVKYSQISYIQVFRNSSIEAVSIFTHDREPNQEPNTIAPVYEQEVIKALQSYCQFLNKRSINGPCIVFLSLLNVKGYKMWLNRDFSTPERLSNTKQIDKKDLILPHVYIEDISSFFADKVMKPVFDIVWNACGISGSKNYNNNGEWKNKNHINFS